MTSFRLRAGCAVWLWVAGCGEAGSDDAGAMPDAAPPPQVVFPADFEADYLEMRDCRHSHEHELNHIRVLASPSAQAGYAALSEDTPYPVGATLVKIEYEDPQCSVQLGYTAMRKLAAGANPDGGDWQWQRVDLEREVLEDGAPARCVDCHSFHCAPPFGFDLTCDQEE